MNAYVYILTNRTNSVLYVGVTADLLRRIYEHKEHLDLKSFTARYNVTKLVYFEATGDIRSAIAREKQLKGGSRMDKLFLIREQNPMFEDLYPKLLG